MRAIGDLFNWYRKYGHYLEIFLENPTGSNIITDEYRGKTNYARKIIPRKDYEDRVDTATLARDMLFGMAQCIGGVLGVFYLPDLTAKGGAVMLAGYGVERFWNAFNCLKAKNDLIAYETKCIMDQKKQQQKNLNRPAHFYQFLLKKTG